jgi:hypothetical protein
MLRPHDLLGACAPALVAWVLGAAPLAAQESVFNLPTLGVPSVGESIRSRALGGAALGLDAEPFSLEAPAQLARFRWTGFHLSAVGQRLTVENEGGSGKLEDVSFPMGQVVFPAWGRSALAVGFYQFVDFDATVESEIEFEGDTIPVSLASDGGISVLAPAVAWMPDERTGVGASVDLYLGSRRLVRVLETDDLSPGAVVTSDSLSRDFRAVGVTVSAERGFGDGTRIAAAYRWRPTVDSEITASPAGLEGSAIELDLPSEWTVGGATRVSRRLVVSAATRWSDWSSLDDPAGSDYGSSLEVGAGLEISPGGRWMWIFNPDSPLRFGFRWRKLPLRVAGESVDEWVASAGYGRSFLGARSRVDLVFETGRRGDLDTHGLTERFLRIGLGLSAFEQWRGGAPGRP